MNTYYVKMLIFIFLISTLVSPHNSRLLAQTKNHNPHYHNDPELKEIIDKMNGEAIKKYQQTHDPYKKLKELVEKNRTKLTSGNGAEPMSTLKNDLLETYEEMFGKENHIMLKSGMHPNDEEKSSTCECTDINNRDLTKKKGKDKYLKHLKHRCIGGICSCSVGSFLLAWFGLYAAKAVAANIVLKICELQSISLSVFTMNNILNASALQSAVAAIKTIISGCAADAAGSAVGSATAVLTGCGIAALVLLILAVVLIILYIWLYRRRKNSYKHECKKHLCK
ncbi:stevor [Plasmodium reichenowi]|uniref:Stevor n=1 Tax=Plasmodium reichenowi TaxID=5854 RepID=A0A060RM67_PLARE|nr:stevor [Plasmodium reichenowi]